MKQADTDRTPARAPGQKTEDTIREAALKAYALVKAARDTKAAPR